MSRPTELSARELPADDPACGWLHLEPRLRWSSTLGVRESADLVVVGAGFTGLAVARRYAELEPGACVLLLEAQNIGWGASGRNAGFVVDLTDFAREMPRLDRLRYVRLARRGIEALKTQARKGAPPRGWDEGGYLRAAAGEEGLKLLQQWPAALNEIGSPHRWLGRDEVAAVTGTTFYRAALHLPGAIQVQPLPLLHRLVKTLPSNVELRVRRPVKSVARRRGVGAGFRLVAAGSCIKARQVVIAVNGYSNSLGLLGRRVLPRFTFASLTAELSTEQRMALGGEPSWGLLAIDPLGSTLKRLQGRIFIRNTLRHATDLASGAVLKGEVVAAHRGALLARFPQLGDGLRFEYSWSGVMGVSLNGRPFLGELAPGLYAVAGYNGAGIAMGTALGMTVAELASGADNEALADALALTAPALFPPLAAQRTTESRRVAALNERAGAYL